MITAEEPSDERTSPVMPSPIAANVSAPSARTTMREMQAVWAPEPRRGTRPMQMISTASIRKTRKVEASTASR